MSKTIVEKICKAFFTNLAQSGGVCPETIEQLKNLYQTGKLADKKRLAQLAQDMPPCPRSRH